MDKLLKKKRARILKLASKHGAFNVRVFGSAARGEMSADSDVDFLIEFEKGRNLFDRIALMQDLEDLLGKKVDVLTPKTIHWYIKEKVMSEAVPL